MASARNPEQPTATLLRERIRRIFKEFPGTLAGEEEPVHQVRVAGRRLRVALPLLARRPGGRRVRRARRILRDLTRAAGSGRDLDVLLALFEARLSELDEVSKEQRDLRRRMRAARTRSRGGLTEGILDLDIDGLRRQLRSIRAKGTPDTETILSRIRTASERDGQKVIEGLAEVGDRYDPEALHALRRLIRELRYTAEVDEALRGRPAGASAVWKKLQDAIGVLHDVHVLTEWLEKQSERAGARCQAELAAAAEEERSFFEAEARRLHAQLLEARPVELAGGALRIITGAEPGDGAPSKDGAGSSAASTAPRSPFPAARRSSAPTTRAYGSWPSRRVTPSIPRTKSAP
jgi:CHAD domain-containing protein